MSERNTPACVVDAVRSFRPIGLDPCSNATSIVRARVEYRLPRRDGLELPWRGVLARNEIAFINPSWDNHPAWVEKLRRERARALYWCPVYPETAWAKSLFATPDPAICFWGKRVNHPNPANTRKLGPGSMWPTMLVGCFLPPSERARFVRSFSGFGTCMAVTS